MGQINFFWNIGFLLGVAILLQIVTGIFLALHYTSDINSAYYSIFFLIREVNGGCVIFIQVVHHLYFVSYFYISEELYFMVHISIILILGILVFLYFSY